MFSFACKMPNHAPFGRFWGQKTPEFQKFRILTHKGTSLRDFASFEGLRAKIGPSVWPGRDPEKKKKKSHRTRIFHPRLGAPPLIRSGPFLGGFVAPSDVITHTNFEMNRLRNLGVAEGQNVAF